MMRGFGFTFEEHSAALSAVAECQAKLLHARYAFKWLTSAEMLNENVQSDGGETREGPLQESFATAVSALAQAKKVLDDLVEKTPNVDISAAASKQIQKVKNFLSEVERSSAARKDKRLAAASKAKAVKAAKEKAKVDLSSTESGEESFDNEHHRSCGNFDDDAPAVAVVSEFSIDRQLPLLTKEDYDNDVPEKKMHKRNVKSSDQANSAAIAKKRKVTIVPRNRSSGHADHVALRSVSVDRARRRGARADGSDSGDVLLSHRDIDRSDRDMPVADGTMPLTRFVWANQIDDVSRGLERRCAKASLVSAGSRRDEKRNHQPKDAAMTRRPNRDDMVANWFIGTECRVRDLAENLCKSSFDFICIVVSSDVAKQYGTEEVQGVHQIRENSTMSFLQHLCKQERCNRDPDQHKPVFPSRRKTDEPAARLDIFCIDYTCAVHDVLGEKFCYRLGDSNIFIACHKAKVSGFYLAKHCIRSRGGPDDFISFFNVQLTLCNTRQMMQAVTVGMLDVRGELTDTDVEALAQWAVQEKLDMITGYFGRSRRYRNWISDFATQAGAISDAPLAQSVFRNGHSLMHPSFFIFFSHYADIKTETSNAEVPDTLELGQDILRNMVETSDSPQWIQHQGCGRSFGRITMKKVDFSKWFQGCFQTVIWLHASTSGQGPLQRDRRPLQRDRRNKMYQMLGQHQ